MAIFTHCKIMLLFIIIYSHRLLDVLSYFICSILFFLQIILLSSQVIFFNAPLYYCLLLLQSILLFQVILLSFYIKVAQYNYCCILFIVPSYFNYCFLKLLNISSIAIYLIYYFFIFMLPIIYFFTYYLFPVTLFLTPLH